MNKNLLAVFSILLLSATCNLFGGGGTTGAVKTINGGADWTAINQLGQEGSLGSFSLHVMRFDPKNREIIYAGTANGGLYKSENSGDNWVNILDKIAVNDLAVSPEDSGVIYAAGSFSGVGKVLKTTDGGKSWQQKYSEATAETPVRSISLNPSNPQQMVIATESGNVIRSLDGGESWQLLRNFQSRINQVVWTNHGVYALVRSGGLYKGSGTADDFVELTGAMKSQNFFDQFSNSGAIQVFNQTYVDPLSSNLIYLTTNRGLFKSVDSGKNWQAVKLPVKQENLNARAIAVSRQSSNVVLTSVGNVVYKSTDGGISFQTQSVPGLNSFVNVIIMDPERPQIIYAGLYLNQ